MENVSDAPPALELVPMIENVISRPTKKAWGVWQVFRFGIVGSLNTFLDILVFNILLFCSPTHNTGMLLVYSSLAYAIGAINSYLMNKHWTFRHTKRTTRSEVLRFVCVNVFGILCNDTLIWSTAHIVHPMLVNTVVWANVSKIVAILGTISISYLGMRLWVFANIPYNAKPRHALLQRKEVPMVTHASLNLVQQKSGLEEILPDGTLAEHTETSFLTGYSLSVILPCFNEEKVIATTIVSVIEVLTPWVKDFTVIVVNDGSTDSTQSIVQEIVATDSRVQLIQHPVNQGYGAALASGFEVVTTDLVFFTDSDGQFDISDLQKFFPLIDTYDAVLGYRIDRQDTWMRKLNAWCWKMLVRFVLHVRVRDVDCAFKLYRTDFFRHYPLETRGAMINTEILYKLQHYGYTFAQVGVRHLPRNSGKATGANSAVILRALRELYVFARKWHFEEKATISFGGKEK
ncbi:MAG: hypothetical protein PVS3B3_33100 [Ktedonobacteraceae bacterium]